MNFYKNIKEAYPVMPQEQEQRMFLILSTTTDEVEKKRVRDEIILHNMGLVQKNIWAYSTSEEETEDLFSYGVQGLIKAVEDYDLSKGTKFSTYATWYIRKYCREGRHANILRRMPEYIWEGLFKFNRAREEFLKENGRYPTYKPCFLDNDFEEESELEKILVVPGNNRLTHFAYKQIVQMWESKNYASLDDLYAQSDDSGKGKTIEEMLPEASVPEATFTPNWVKMEIRGQIEKIRNSGKKDCEEIAQVLELFADGYNYKEVAEILHQPVVSVKRWYEMGRRRLARSNVLRDMCDAVLEE